MKGKAIGPGWAALAAMAILWPQVGWVAEPPHVHSHAHAAGGLAVSGLQLKAGQQWATDLPLRQAMTNLRQRMARALPPIHRQQLREADYAQLATAIHAQVGSIVERCRLAPEADAMLHLVIADLSSGADMMAGKNAEDRLHGAQQVVEALNAYGQHFRHPGWQPLRHE